MNSFDQLPKRFADKVDSTGDCWIWTAHKLPKGYGVIYSNGKNERAHRFSWKIFNGEIPDGLWVLHKCDNPSCVNPEHLFLGTNQDNRNDMVKKGRQPKKENHWFSKLTQAQVDEIRKTYRYGRSGDNSSTSLAKKYGVGKNQILYIVTNKSWAV